MVIVNLKTFPKTMEILSFAVHKHTPIIQDISYIHMYLHILYIAICTYIYVCIWMSTNNQSCGHK